MQYLHNKQNTAVGTNLWGTSEGAVRKAGLRHRFVDLANFSQVGSQVNSWRRGQEISLNIA